MLQMNVEFTGERFVPGAGGAEIAGEHAHRYLAIEHLIADKRVLDLGCGTGYGSILLRGCAHYLGIDIDEASVANAKSAFGGERIDFRVGDVMATGLEPNSFDVVVSFEVIEHVGDPALVIREAQRLLTPGGLLIVSTPDKVEYNSNKAEPNPFHPSELTKDELWAILSAHFAHVRLLGQRFTSCSGIFDPEQLRAPGLIYLPDGTFASPPIPIYWVALASDDELPEYLPSALLIANERDYDAEIAAAANALAGAGARIAELEAAQSQLAADHATLQRRYDYVSHQWAKWTLQKWRRRG